MVLLIAKNFQLVKFSQVDFLKKTPPIFVQTDGEFMFLNYEPTIKMPALPLEMCHLWWRWKCQ